MVNLIEPDRYNTAINDAAVIDPVPFQNLDALTPEIWDWVLNTNLRGPFFMTRAPLLSLGGEIKAAS